MIELDSIEHSCQMTSPRVWCINWMHNGKSLASCGDDKSVKIWRHVNDVNNGKKRNAGFDLTTTIRGDHTRTIRCVCFSPCDRFLATASFDASLIIYVEKDNDFEEIHKLEGHESEIKCCAFSISGEFLATCSRDKTVWIWQVVEDNDWEVAAILQNHTADVKFVIWHPNEDMLASGGYDCSIRFYEFDGEDWITQHHISDAHEGTVWSGSFDRSGSYFASCGSDRIVKIWKRNSSTGKRWEKFSEYRNLESRWPIYSISWSHLNGLIAVGGGDSTIWVLKLDEDNEAMTSCDSLRLGAEINSVRWNPKFDDLLAVSCDDGTVRIIFTRSLYNNIGILE